MSQWPALRETSWLQRVLDNPVAARHWQDVLDKSFVGQIDSWDIQWVFTCWAQNGLTILPNINLVSNIGFGGEATHTKTDIYEVAELPFGDMELPLEHPPAVVRDKDADSFTFNRIFAREVERPSMYRKIGRRLLAVLPDPLRDSIGHLRAK
jgi:hypothetical protein